MKKWDQGTYKIQNPEKYVGSQPPTFRSSWERRFCLFCDTHPSIIKWASENLKIPYFNPLTNRMANYIPDFLIQYIDKEGVEHTELIEIKPRSQTTMESAGRSKRNQAAVILNAAKWDAAKQYCDRRGIHFKVITEDQIFSKPGKARRKKR